MKDVQKTLDTRNVYLNEVGVKGLHYPLRILKKTGEYQSVQASLSLFVDLDSSQKGVHMSRFVEVIDANRDLDLNYLDELMGLVKERLQSSQSFLRIEFKYFIEKKSPVTNLSSLFDVEVCVEVKQGKSLERRIRVITPVTTLCPCSKEISEYSAHNQRADIAIDILTSDEVYIEDLVEISELASSSPIFSLLKRPDEKFVTEKAYENPRFVEDVCREVKLSLDRKYRAKKFVVEVQSYESIHNHIAYAKVVKNG